MEWIWDSDCIDAKRLERAASTVILPGTLDRQSGTALFQGAEDIYETSLTACTCMDFVKREGASPCKHILRLGIELGFIDEHGLNQKEQKLLAVKDLQFQIALAYGMDKRFHQPIMSDASYDALVRHYNRLMGTTRPQDEPPLHFIHAEALIFFLIEQGIPFEDQRPYGGPLCIPTSPELDTVLCRVFVRGKPLQRLDNVETFDGKPIWYFR